MATVSAVGLMPATNEELADAELFQRDALYEVVNNQIRELPPMSAREIHLASTLMRILSSFAWSGGLGHVESEMLFLLQAAKNLHAAPTWHTSPSNDGRAASRYRVHPLGTSSPTWRLKS